jgi:hypothetical protein
MMMKLGAYMAEMPVVDAILRVHRDNAIAIEEIAPRYLRIMLQHGGVLTASEKELAELMRMLGQRVSPGFLWEARLLLNHTLIPRPLGPKLIGALERAKSPEMRGLLAEFSRPATAATPSTTGPMRWVEKAKEWYKRATA